MYESPQDFTRYGVAGERAVPQTLLAGFRKVMQLGISGRCRVASRAPTIYKIPTWGRKVYQSGLLRASWGRSDHGSRLLRIWVYSS